MKRTTSRLAKCSCELVDEYVAVKLNNMAAATPNRHTVLKTTFMENKRSKTRELTPEELRTETAVTDVRHREFIQLAEQGDVACVQTQAKSAQLIPRLDQKKWLPHDICSDTTKKQIEDWLEE